MVLQYLDLATWRESLTNGRGYIELQMQILLYSGYKQLVYNLKFELSINILPMLSLLFDYTATQLIDGFSYIYFTTAYPFIWWMLHSSSLGRNNWSYTEIWCQIA